jgi:hypothetical protein
MIGLSSDQGDRAHRAIGERSVFCVSRFKVNRIFQCLTLDIHGYKRFGLVLEQLKPYLVATTGDPVEPTLSNKIHSVIDYWGAH